MEKEFQQLMNDKGKQFISDLKLYTDYLKYDESLNRYETWEEACDKVLNTHIMRYGEIARPLIDKVKPYYHKKMMLASQRNLQFREDLILRNNCKLYNCCTTYCYSPDVFDKGFFVLLSGTGLGVSLKNKFVSQLPLIYKRSSDTKTYVIEDSIEGWAKAVNVLMSSYCSHLSLQEEYFGYKIRFDYSQIRLKGSLIRGGFQAPGPQGLKQSLEKIETLLEKGFKDTDCYSFRSIIAYDIFMHLSDAVLSGGVRRSAMNVIIDEDDEEMMNAKMGNWRTVEPQRARSNNSVGLIKHSFTKDRFRDLVDMNEGDNDLGFVLMKHEDEMFNPCFEISFNFYNQIKNRNEAVFQFCNLNEINASACVDEYGNFSEDVFYELCAAAAILGTLQAGYTSFPYLGKQTEEIVAGEALLGVSITGWMTRPELFNENILRAGADVVKANNLYAANVIGINAAARSTTVKPSGNASVILQTASGIHPEHSERYFRIMQLNKESETAKWMEINRPEMLEESAWSNTKSDYVVYSPCENVKGTMYKDDMQGVKHLKLIELVQNSWVKQGKREDLCYNPLSEHNVSNTVIVDNPKEIVDYIFDNQNNFTAVSFLSLFGDKDYEQAPFTSVLTTKEIFDKYGEGTVFMSGLIVDGLHYFSNDLWSATRHILDKDLKFTGDRTQVLLKKDWVRRAKKFAHNYFNDDLQQMIYCMKDVHLLHKWNTIQRSFEVVDFTKILTKPSYLDIDTLGAISCSGGQCEVV
jgi:ribonucleoside-triphosphate reductase